MSNAISRETGEPVFSKEQENGQREQSKRVQQEEGEVVPEKLQTNVRFTPNIPANHIDIEFKIGEDDICDEEREVGTEAVEVPLDQTDPNLTGDDGLDKLGEVHRPDEREAASVSGECGDSDEEA